PQARKDWATALHGLAQGCDPAAAREDAKLKAATAQANTLAAVCDSHLKRKKMRTSDQRERILRKLVLPKLGNRPITSIRRSEIVALLDGIEDNNGARTADVALGHLRAVMNWFAARDDEFQPPFVRGMGRQVAAEHRRSRVPD